MRLALLVIVPLALSAPAAGAPRRIVSVNLCTDELLLMLARPEQIAAVTHLSQMPEESPLWRQARQYAKNDGSLVSVARHRPDLVLAMGNRGGDRLRIAEQLGIPTLALPYPMTLDAVASNVRKVADAVGRRAEGEALVRQMTELERTAPPPRIDSAWLSGGGRSVRADSLTAQWMALAGLRQRALTGDRVSLELLITRPPRLLLRSNYRQQQYSMEQRWLDHPRVREAWPRTVLTDGRRWLCNGPLLVDEIRRIRRRVEP